MEFSRHGSRQVLAAFDGGKITSDAGLLLLCECEHKLDLSTRMASCSRHGLPELLSQRNLKTEKSLVMDAGLKACDKKSFSTLN